MTNAVYTVIVEELELPEDKKVILANELNKFEGGHAIEDFPTMLGGLIRIYLDGSGQGKENLSKKGFSQMNIFTERPTYYRGRMIFVGYDVSENGLLIERDLTPRESDEVCRWVSDRLKPKSA